MADQPQLRRQSEPLPPDAPTWDWDQFYGDLAAAINAQLAAVYPTPITLVQQPAQGDFLWFYEANGLFNQGTFDYLSANVAPSTEYPVLAALSVSGGFVNSYAQVVGKIAYTMSSAQQTEINRVTQAAAVQGLTIVVDYQTLFGQITPAQIAEAQAVCGTVVQGALDYVISYMLGAIWSGRAAARAPLLTYQEMQKAGSAAALVAMLPLMPSTGVTVVGDVWAWLEATASVAAVQSQAQTASWLIAQLLANTADPDTANGGMRTIDPVTGLPLPADQVSYSISRSIAEIQTDLLDQSRVLIASAILESSDGLESVKLTLRYTGYTLVPIAALPWSTANTGWFSAGPIASAYANQSRNITGYHFIADPGALQPFAFGGTFGMITNLVISNTPTVTFEQAPKPTARATVDRVEAPAPPLALLRPLGLSAEQVNYSVTTALDAATGHAITVYTPTAMTAAPSVAEVGVPLLMQSAYVIGCTISNPAVNG